MIGSVSVPNYVDYNYQKQLKAYQDAQAAESQRNAQNAGTAAGTAQKAAYEAKYPGYQTPPPPTAGGSGGSSMAALQGLSSFQPSAQPMPQAPTANSFPTSSAQGTTPPPLAHLAAPDSSGAQANEFARAKDQVGLQTRGAITGLAGAMAGRGTVGSGVEGRGQQQIVGQGQQQLGEVSRDQAITGANLAQKDAEAEYQGSIAQRGQDISRESTINSQMLEARGQDINNLNTARGQQLSSQDAASQRALQALIAQFQAQSRQPSVY